MENFQLSMNLKKCFQIKMEEEKIYKLEITNKVDKFLRKLDKTIRKYCLKKIFDLAKNPVPKDKRYILDINKNSFLCELAVDKVRIYYMITHGSVKINEIEYLGKVEVKDASNSHKSGNKKNYPRQREDIKKMKKDFKK